MSPPINIDGSQVSGVTIDGTDVIEVTVDGTTVFSAIPDSDVFHFAADGLNLSDGDTVTSWPDKSTRNNDLTDANGAPKFETNQINSLPTVLYDGSDDRHESSGSVSDISQPYIIYIVFQALENSGTLRPFSFNSTNNVEFNTESSWKIFAGNQVVSGGTGDTSVHGAKLVFDGANSEIIISGTTVASGDAGALPVNDVSIGGRFQNDFFTNIRVGELIGYQNPSSKKQSNAENGLSSKWNVTF